MPSFPRVFTILRRLAGDPRLLPEVLAKAKARWTLRFHRRRLDELARLEIPVTEALAPLLDVTPERVAETLAEDALRGRLRELETWLDQPESDGRPRTSGAAYLELLYAVVRLARPRAVVETGVSRGFSSTILLTALEENGEGHLYGNDLPAFRPGEDGSTGSAVPPDLATSPRWHWRLGPDRRELPKLLDQAQTVDLVHYDSDKSYEGMTWALEILWDRLEPGGLLIFDDADSNDAFLDFADRLEQAPRIVAKPTRRSVYRWRKKYYVGLLRKPTSA